MRDPNEKVVVATLNPGNVESAFMESLIYLLLYDVSLHKRIVHGGGIKIVEASANLAGPRNAIVKQYLTHSAEWLLMVDSDMTFPPNIVEQLLEYADPDKAPIVGALCFGFDDKGEVQPTLYTLAGEADDPAHLDVLRYHEWPPESMFQVTATGTGCLLMHRSVFDRMANAELPNRPGKRGFNDAFPWFQELEHNGSPVGEDIGFCWRAGLLGIPVFVNTAVQCGHIKRRLLTMESYFLANGLLSPQHAGAQP
jgi:hypothetical protein